MDDKIFEGLPSGAIGPQTLSDSELVQEVTRRAARERTATAELIRALIEFDRRRLFLAEGYPSLFAYCTGALHYSEYSAFNRIEVARAAARWPQLLARLEDGSLHLSGARLLAPHLTADNVEAVLEIARHKSKRDIEEIAAHLAHRSVLVAAGDEEFRLHLTISRSARDTLQKLQALLAHQVRNGNPAVIVERALALLLDTVQRKRQAATARPRRTPPETSAPPSKSGRSRHIPAAVKRAVWERDGLRCAFVGAQGRCAERRHLELHHVVPFSAGGAATLTNIQVRCRAHNMYEAETYFGADVVTAARKRSSSRDGDSVHRVESEPHRDLSPEQVPTAIETHEVAPTGSGQPGDPANLDEAAIAGGGGNRDRTYEAETFGADVAAAAGRNSSSRDGDSVHRVESTPHRDLSPQQVPTTIETHELAQTGTGQPGDPANLDEAATEGGGGNRDRDPGAKED